MTYAYYTEWMSRKEQDDFDRRLGSAASGGSAGHGTKELFALMGVKMPGAGA